MAAAKRAVLEGPAAATADDDARFDVVASGEREEFVARQQTGEAGYRATDEAGLLLPETAQERRRRETPQQSLRGRIPDAHDARVALAPSVEVDPVTMTHPHSIAPARAIKSLKPMNISDKTVVTISFKLFNSDN